MFSMPQVGLPGMAGLSQQPFPGGLSPSGSSLAGNNFSALSGVTKNSFTAGLKEMGVSSSTLMLMSQINMMMASVLTGIMAFIQQLMASQANRQSVAANGSSEISNTGSASGSTAEMSAVSGSSGTSPGSSGNPGAKGFAPPLDGNVGGNTGDFGPRVPPTAGASSYHQGVDIARPEGTPIKAVAGGKIVAIEPNAGGAGNMITIDHGNGVQTRYLHMSPKGFGAGLKVGDTVNQGQVIGGVGNTGISTGAHLHFEVRVNGKAVDPITYIPQLK